MLLLVAENQFAVAILLDAAALHMCYTVGQQMHVCPNDTRLYGLHHSLVRSVDSIVAR